MQCTSSLDLLHSLFPGQVVLGVGETARALGLSSKTISNLLAAGTFPIKPINFGGHGRCFFVVDLANYIDEQRAVSKRRPGRPRKALRFEAEGAV